MKPTMPPTNDLPERTHYKHSLLRLTLIGWLVCTLIFCGLMIAAYSFPDAWVNDHVRSSGKQLISEGIYPKGPASTLGTKRDNYTDGYVLGMISHQDGHPIRSAFLNPYYDNDQALAGDHNARLTSVVDGIGHTANQTYGRYWQGHLVLERPLMIFLDLQGIYVVMAMILVLLVLWAGAGLFRRLGWFGPVILLISLLLVDPVSISFSTKFWYSFAIAIAGIGWISWFSARYPFEGQRASMFFFVMGAVTVFLDFLSTPILTFMMPFVTLILIRREEIGKLINKEALLTGGRHFLFWIAGWVLLGLTNWLIFIAFAQGSHVDGFEMIRVRWEHWVGSGDLHARQLSRFAGIGEIISIFGLPFPGKAVLGTAGVLSLLPAILTPSRYRAGGILLTLTCAIPIVWCIILSASVYDHAWAVFRMCAGLFFTWLAGAYLLLPPLRRRDPSPLSPHRKTE